MPLACALGLAPPWLAGRIKHLHFRAFRFKDFSFQDGIISMINPISMRAAS
jgi:hypothetical protein